MPRAFGAKDVQCPFYCKNDLNRIVCEGLFERNKINLTFELPEERRMYMQEVCNKLLGCRDCPMYIVLSEKYGVDI